MWWNAELENPQLMFYCCFFSSVFIFLDLAMRKIRLRIFVLSDKYVTGHLSLKFYVYLWFYWWSSFIICFQFLLQCWKARNWACQRDEKWSKTATPSRPGGGAEMTRSPVTSSNECQKQRANYGGKKTLAFNFLFFFLDHHWWNW